jgi:hypothetical protein
MTQETPEMERNIQVARDIDEIDEILDMAEACGGTLGLTSNGRLVIYGLRGTAEAVTDRINAKGSPDAPAGGWFCYVDALDPDALGLRI